MRFLIFGGSTYYPAGGWKDLIGHSDSYSAALSVAVKAADEIYRWAQVVDTIEKGIVWEGERGTAGLSYKPLLRPSDEPPRIGPPCSLCGNDLTWHAKHRPRHPFTLNSGAEAGPLTDEELASMEAGLREHPDEEDNARLLRLVAEVRRLRREVGTMRPYLDHKFACAVSREIRQGLGVESACSCGLAELRAS